MTEMVGLCGADVIGQANESVMMEGRRQGTVLDLIDINFSAPARKKVKQKGKVIVNKCGRYAGKGSMVKVFLKKGDIIFSDVIEEVHNGLTTGVSFSFGILLKTNKIEDFEVLG